MDCDFIDMLKAIFEPKFKLFSTRGYSQGDYAEVIVNQKSWLYEKDESEVQDYIDRLFWDCPISVYISLNRDDLEAYEYLTDEYKWDKSEFIDNMRKQREDLSPEFFDELEQMLPDEPEWQY